MQTAPSSPPPSLLALTPPMGWMSWGRFRCAEHVGGGLDCAAHPESCIGEWLYHGTADALVRGGFTAAGYRTLHVDDCWEAMHRDSAGELRPNASRFPSGFGGPRGLVSYVRARGLTLGLYSDAGSATCGGFPGSWGHEARDASMFEAWGVSYLKQDGCHVSPKDLAQGYVAMGAALRALRSTMVYSCSWPAYLGDDEANKPFDAMAAAGCNLWRNWHDVQCSWASVSSIIEHWGRYSAVLQSAAGPGRWNDPDMLLVGALDGRYGPCLTAAQERTQLAIWAIIAAPLIMGNDVRNISQSSRALLLNRRAIAVSQDTMGRPGGRLSASQGARVQIWARHLSNGDVAVGLYHRGTVFPPPIPPPPCEAWEHAWDGFWESGYGQNLSTFSKLNRSQAQAICCADPKCAGFSFHQMHVTPSTDANARGEGEFKADLVRGFVRSEGYEGFAKPSQIRAAKERPVAVVLPFASVGMQGRVRVVDIWSGEDLGVFNSSFITAGVALHDTAFLRLSLWADEKAA